MDDLYRIRQLAGLKEASTGVMYPGGDFYPPGMEPRSIDDKTVYVPPSLPGGGGGGGGGSSGAKGGTSTGEPGGGEPASSSPSTMDKIKDFAKSVTEPKDDDSQPVKDIKQYWRDKIEPPPAKSSSDSEPVTVDFIDLDEPGDIDADKLAKDLPSGQAALPGKPVVAYPQGDRPSTGDTSLPPVTDKTHITVDPSKRPPPLDFSEPKQDFDKLPGQGGAGSEANPLIVTPKKKEAPLPTMTMPKIPAPPEPKPQEPEKEQPKPEEPKKEPEKVQPKITPPTAAPIAVAPQEPKKEPEKVQPKIAPPSAAPIAVAPSPVTPVEPKPAPSLKPSAVPAPAPTVTFPAPIAMKPVIPGPSAAPVPTGPSAGSGGSVFGTGDSTGQGTGQGVGQGTGQGPGQGSGRGGGSGSGIGPGRGSGEGPGSGSGSGGGPGGAYKGHKWFQYELGGVPSEVPPGKLPPGWKHIGGGRYVSELPLDQYRSPEHAPPYPGGNRSYMDKPDWSTQYHPVRENTQPDQEMEHLKTLSGIREQSPQTNLVSTFGGGINTSPKAPEPIPASPTNIQPAPVQPKTQAQQPPQQDDDDAMPQNQQPPRQQQQPPQQPQYRQQQPQYQQPATQWEPNGPEYTQRYKSGARPPPLIFQEPSYGGPIVGPGYRGPVYRGPNPYRSFGQGRR